jgi:cell division initiation protein
MILTPLDIQQQRFRTRFRGFDVREVDAFLEQIADAFELIQRQNENLRDEIRRLEQETQGYQKREETFRKALLNSQQVLDQMKENAEKSAEIVVADAEVKAEKILNRAYQRLANLHEEIAELKRQRMQIEVQVRAILESHTKLLDIGTEEMKVMDEEDAKLKYMK